MEALARQWCAEHPDRHSHATCMSCRKLLCQECTTQSDGINYCRACVISRAAVRDRAAGRLQLIAMLLLTAVFLFALARLIVGFGVVLAGML